MTDRASRHLDPNLAGLGDHQGHPLDNQELAQFTNEAASKGEIP